MSTIERGDISSIRHAKDQIDSTLGRASTANQIDDMRVAINKMAADDSIRREALKHLDARVRELGLS